MSTTGATVTDHAPVDPLLEHDTHSTGLVLGCTLPEALAAAALATSNRGGRVLLSHTLTDHALVAEVLRRHGRSTSTVDPTDIDDVGHHVDEHCQALLVETLTPDADLVDLGGLAELCHSHDVTLVVDHGRLAHGVVDPTDVGAALSVAALDLGDAPRTEVLGTPFPLSLLHRVVVQAGVSADPVQGLPAPLPDARAGVGDVSALPGVVSVEEVDLTRTTWGSELLADVTSFVVTTESPLDLPVTTSASSGIVRLTERTALVHARWDVPDWPGTLGTRWDDPPAVTTSRAARLDLDPSRDVSREVSRRRARAAVAAQPWASQWTTRVEVTGDGSTLQASLVPSVWCASRLVRPFDVRVPADDTTAATALLALATAADLPDDDTAVARATLADGLDLKACLLRESGGEWFATTERTSPEPLLSSPDATTHGEPVSSWRERGLVVDVPWQEGGLDLGPDPGELVLLACALDLAAAVAETAGTEPWNVLVEARRDLRPDAPRPGLGDGVAYVTLPPHADVESLVDRWRARPTAAMLVA